MKMNGVEFETKPGEKELMNWGRAINDAWLDHHLLFTPPPTSGGYVADTNAFDDPEPARIPVDEHAARLSEHVVISIGCEVGGFDLFRVLVHWYTRLVFLECTHSERVKRLSKRMKCSYPGAERMLEDARVRFWEQRQVVDGLVKVCKAQKI